MRSELDSVESFKNHFSTHSRIRDTQGHSSKVHSVGWNVDGRRLASGSYDKQVSIYAIDRERVQKETSFKGHTNSVDQLCWHPKNPDVLATASLDKTVRFWDIRSSRCFATIPTRGENINMCWSPDGKTIAVANKEDVVSFIDFKSRKVKYEHPFRFEVNEISWNNDNDFFFLTSGTGNIHVLSYPQLVTVHVFSAHPATCICIDFDKTGRYFAVGSADATVSIWDVQNVCCIRTVSRLEWPIRTLSFSFDGKLLASASEDLMIDISSVETGQKIIDIPTETPTFTVSFHPRKYLLAYACDDTSRDTGIVKVFGFPSERSD